jgi:hypothetical protein
MHERHGGVQPDNEVLPAVLGRYSSLLMEVLETCRGAKYVANALFNIGHVGLRIADIIRPVHLGSKYGLIGVSLDYGGNHNHKTNHMDAFRSKLP